MSPFTPLPESPHSTRIRPRGRAVRAAALGVVPRTLYVHPPVPFERPWWSGPMAELKRGWQSTLRAAASGAQLLSPRPGFHMLLVAARGQLLPKPGRTLRGLAFEAVLGAAALLAVNAVLMLVGIVATSFALAHVPGTAGGVPFGQFCGGLAFWWMQRRYGLAGAFAMHGAFNAMVLMLSRL